MAISVKLFTSDLDCPEPQYQLPVEYSSVSAADLCNGNGVVTNIFGDFSSLQDIYTNFQTGDASNAPNEDVCLDGMDVVFVVDYTGSMSNAISGVKTGINNIVTEIQSESNGDYRLGLVLFDGSSNSSPANYQGSDYYQDLPDDQKIVAQNTGNSGGYNYITCVEKMDQIANATTFGQNLNSIDQPNSATGMALGHGIECGGLACYEVIQNDFAGIFRQDALKVIILITDDDAENAVDFQNTLIPTAETSQVQLFLCTEQPQGSSPSYEALVNNINPQGTAYFDLTYNSTWAQTTVVAGLQELCATTVTYTCQPAAVGWYGEYPVGAGDTVYYWDGTSWTNTYQCPLEVRVHLVDSLSNATIDNIDPNNAYYLDSDTFSFSGAPGDVFTVTASATSSAGYDNLSIASATTSENSSMPNTYSIGDDGGAISTTINNTPQTSTESVSITVTLPTNATCCGVYEWDVTLKGSASQIQYQLDLSFSENINDAVNAAGGANTGPNGTIYLTEVTPSGWTASGTGAPLQPSTLSRTFTEPAGTPITVELQGIPMPSDYTLAFSGYGFNYASSAGVGQTLGTAMSQPGALTGDTVSISFNMPTGGGVAAIYLTGTCTQPIYRYELDCNDQITGATVDSADQNQVFEGYTDDVFSFSVDLSPDSGYSSYNITSAFDSTFGGSNNISNMSVHPNGQTYMGDVTMPSGGATGDSVSCTGTATQTQESYTISVSHSYSYASYNPITITGIAGSTHSGTITALTTLGYQWDTPTVSSNDTTNLTGSAGSPNPDIDYSLTMPSGGGSGILTVSGVESPRNYDFQVGIQEPYSGGFYSGQPTKMSNYIFNTYTFGYGTSQSFIIPFTPAAGKHYTVTNIAVSGNNASSLVANNNSNSVPGLPTDVDMPITITMPLGGGDALIDVSGLEFTPSYNMDFIIDNGISNSHYHVDGGLTERTGQFTKTNAAFANQSKTIVIDVDPDPSNYVLTINENSTSISGTDAGSFGAIQYDHLAGEITVTYTQPARDATATLTIGGTSINPKFDFNLTIATNIPNTSVSQTSDTSNDVAGTSHTYGPYTIIPNTDYSVTVSSVSKSGKGANSITPNFTSTTIGADLTNRPAQNSGATITAEGSSSLKQYTAVITFSDDCRGGGNPPGNWNSASVSFTGAAGSTHTIQNTYVLNNSSTNKQIDTFSVDHSDTGPISNQSYGATGSTSIGYSATFTMPSESTGHGGSYSATACSNTTLVDIQRIVQVEVNETYNGISLGSANVLGPSGHSQQVFQHTGAIGSSFTNNVRIYADTGTWDFDFSVPAVTGLTFSSLNPYQVSRGYADFTYSGTIPSTDQVKNVYVSASNIEAWDITFDLYNGLGASAILPRTLYWNETNCNEGCTPRRSLTYSGTPAIGTAGKNMLGANFSFTDRSGAGNTWMMVDYAANPTNTGTCMHPDVNPFAINRTIDIDVSHPTSLDTTQNPQGVVVTDTHVVTQYAKPEITWQNTSLTFPNSYAGTATEYFTQNGSAAIAPTIEVSDVTVIDTGDGTNWVTVSNPYGTGNGNQSYSQVGSTGKDGYFTIAVSQSTGKARQCTVRIIHPMQVDIATIFDCNNVRADRVQTDIIVTQLAATTQPPCNVYEVNNASFKTDLRIEYTDCSTGLLTVARISGPTEYVCSQTTPVITSGTGSVQGSLYTSPCEPGGNGVGNPYGGGPITTSSTTSTTTASGGNDDDIDFKDDNMIRE